MSRSHGTSACLAEQMPGMHVASSTRWHTHALYNLFPSIANDVLQTPEDASSELAELRERCSDQAKEREALHTILDAKIRALVKDVASSLQDIPNQVCRASWLCSQNAAVQNRAW